MEIPAHAFDPRPAGRALKEIRFDPPQIPEKSSPKHRARKKKSIDTQAYLLQEVDQWILLVQSRRPWQSWPRRT